MSATITLMATKAAVDSRGDTFVVFYDGACVGEVVRSVGTWVPGWGYLPEKWYVRSAGDGVAVPNSCWPTSDGAVVALLDARSVSPVLHSDASGLTEGERAVLDLEAEFRFVGLGEKERAIRERLRLSPLRYAQILNRLVDDPKALAYAPVLVHRLRERRDARARRIGA
jgi:hypothetical protein